LDQREFRVPGQVSYPKIPSAGFECKAEQTPGAGDKSATTNINQLIDISFREDYFLIRPQFVGGRLDAGRN
jgi:hypothetical protein